MERAKTNLLKALAVPVATTGYIFIKDALDIIKQDPLAVSSLCKAVYISIAEKHDTKWHRVERCIMYAVEKAANQQTSKFIEIFGPGWRPANGEFLATVAEELRLLALEKEETA